MNKFYSYRRGRAPGFTLVELLVVIGIIALLISVLLPALTRARQAANLVDCQARLRQMGQLVHMYAGSNKGLLPWGVVKHEPFNGTSRNLDWWWTYTLSDLVNRNTTVTPAGDVVNVHPMFRDKDTIDGGNPAIANHYTCNPRVLYRHDVPDPAPAKVGAGEELFKNTYPQRKITGVKRADQVFLIWDAPQTFDQGYAAIPVAEAIDHWGFANTGLVIKQTGDALLDTRTDLPICPGERGISGTFNGSALQRTYNLDFRNAYVPNGWLSHLRFRHMKNTTLAALCVDGHVEIRRIGEVLRGNIYTNYR